MLKLEQALDLVLRTAPRPSAAEQVPLAESTGRVLAEDVASDVDLPPFNKSAMDGYAVRSDDVRKVPAALRIVEEIAAGRTPQRRIGRGECAKIMTGAPVPEGADAVVMVEDTRPAARRAGDLVRILRAVRKGQNICPLGEDLRKEETGVAEGTPIRPVEVAILAAMGRSRVKVYRRTKVAFLSTGSEVVQVQHKPAPGQIRDSNSHSVAARLGAMGIRLDCLGIAPDSPQLLRKAIKAGLKRDVLIISGGVSMGEHDWVPEVLHRLGVEVLFRRLAIKPGSPTLFGLCRKTMGRATQPRNPKSRIRKPKPEMCMVFGLPGNPVSTLVITELLLVPMVRKMMGCAAARPLEVAAVSQAPLSHKGDRLSFVPVHLECADGEWRATPVEYHGSADLVGFARGNAIAAVPEGIPRLEKGARTRVTPLQERDWGLPVGRGWTGK
jgi:molybdopterin molybdotransferase